MNVFMKNRLEFAEYELDRIVDKNKDDIQAGVKELLDFFICFYFERLYEFFIDLIDEGIYNVDKPFMYDDGVINLKYHKDKVKDMYYEVFKIDGGNGDPLLKEVLKVVGDMEMLMENINVNNLEDLNKLRDILRICIYWLEDEEQECTETWCSEVCLHVITLLRDFKLLK